MYCSKCGSVLSDGADYCSHCGARCLRRAQGTNTRITVPFLLILLIGILPLFLSLLAIMSSINALNEQGLFTQALQVKKVQIDFWLIAELIPSLLCVLIMTSLVLLGRIDTRRLNYKDVLIWFFVVILSDESMGRGSFTSLVGVNYEAMRISLAYFNTVYTSVFQPHVWRWVVLAVSMLMCSGAIKNTKRLYITVGILLFVWGTGVNVLRTVLAELICDSAVVAVHEYLLHLISTFSMCMPVARIILLCTAVAMWQNSLKIWQLTVIIGMKLLMVFLLKPIFIFRFNLGISGLPLASMFAYIIVGMICMIVMSVNKKKKRAAA